MENYSEAECNIWAGSFLLSVLLWKESISNIRNVHRFALWRCITNMKDEKNETEQSFHQVVFMNLPKSLIELYLRTYRITLELSH